MLYSAYKYFKYIHDHFRQLIKMEFYTFHIQNTTIIYSHHEPPKGHIKITFKINIYILIDYKSRRKQIQTV